MNQSAAETRTGASRESDDSVIDRFHAAGQGHVFRFLDGLDVRGRSRLLRSARAIDLRVVRRLAKGEGLAKPPASFEPLGGGDFCRREDLERDPALRARAEETGRNLMRSGAVACITVAGGQGTRLGFPGPKGCFPIGPDGRTLFDLHAAAVAAATKEAGRLIPWVIVVSPATEEGTLRHFRDRGLPGIDPAAIRIACQGTMPALDDGGFLVLETPDRIATAPDGHGGSLRALRESGTLGWLANLGVEELSYFQVDNPLSPPADPLFLGLHRLSRGRMSTKVFPKADPAERVGVVVRVQGRPAVVEYTEISPESAALRDAAGRLVYGAANMAAHAISLPFAAAVAWRGLPIHRVRKKVPFVDAAGVRVEPDAPNAWKFETFVFDALPMADSGIVLEVERDREFAAVKNATGPDSPDTARALLRAAGRL